LDANIAQSTPVNTTSLTGGESGQLAEAPLEHTL